MRYLVAARAPCDVIYVLGEGPSWEQRIALEAVASSEKVNCGIVIFG